MSKTTLKRGAERNLTSQQVAIIESALWEVLDSYKQATWTSDGVPDFGARLFDLGRMAGLSVPNMAREVQREYGR